MQKLYLFMSLLFMLRRWYSVKILLWGNRVMNYIYSVTLCIFDLLTSRFATIYFSWHKWLLIISLTVLQTCRIYNSQMSESNNSVYRSLTLFYTLLTYIPKHYLIFLICRRYKIESQHIKFSFHSTLCFQIYPGCRTPLNSPFSLLYNISMNK